MWVHVATEQVLIILHSGDGGWLERREREGGRERDVGVRERRRKKEGKKGGNE